MKKMVEQWLQAAGIDIGSMKRIVDDPNLTPAVAFHAQQAIEKSFKAVIAQGHDEPPRTHDLLVLYGQVQKIVQIEIDNKILEAINETYIETRYPTSPTTTGLSIPSKRTVELFVQEAQRIAECCRVHILQNAERV